MEPSICGPCVYGIKVPVFSVQPFGNGEKLLFVVWSTLPVQDVEASVMVWSSYSIYGAKQPIKSVYLSV